MTNQTLGKITHNGYPVLLYSHPQKRDNEVENGIILCDRGAERPHRYVVWVWLDYPDMGTHASSGFYTDNIEEAVADFLERSRIRITDKPKLRIVD